MALQVWLPLTKDLRNQGLNGIPITSAGAINLNDNGKLGKCYKTSNTGFIDLKYTGAQINTGSISLCGWFKFNKSELAATWSDYSFDSTHPYPTGNLIGNNSYGGVGLIWWTNSLASGAAFTSLYAACSIRSSANGARITNAITIPFDTWVHLALIFNKATKALEFWVNGELRVTNTMVDFNDARADNLKLNYSAVWGGNGPSYNIPFLVNDVRIYDHALSSMEVKQLSQGLVLHYPLADAYVESTTNLITTEDCLSSTCYNGATSKYGYGANTDIYKTVTTYDGRKGTKVYMGTNGNNCYPYVYINGMYTSNGTNSPEYKTLSFDYYTTVSTSICPYKLGSGTGTATYIVNANGIERTGTGTNSVVIPIIPNTWNHVEITFHGTTDADAQWGYIQNQPAHVSNTNNFWFFANMQLETKDHATGYAGVGGTRNSNIIYDTSGFCNNGTISGALTISNDTPKYKVSTHMPKAVTITHPRPVFGGVDQEWTCAMWVKLDTVNQSGIAMNNFNCSNNIVHAANSTPLLYLNAGTNDYYNYGNKAVTAGVWTHVAFVFRNSDVTKLIYINGVEQTNKNGPNRTSTPLGIQDVVTVGYNLAGYISDYRVYATALSPTDVKSLYQNCATIDSDGTIRGQIRS